MASPAPDVINLSDPSPFLRWLTENPTASWDLSAIRLVHPFALAGLAALGRSERQDALAVHASDPAAGNARLAHVLGFWEVIEGRSAKVVGEGQRTVMLQRIQNERRLDEDAREIAQFLQPDPEDEAPRTAAQHVLIELFRNALQHSRDELGAVTVAQVMDRGPECEDAPCIQIAVADAGIGIHAALRGYHPNLATPQEALEKALWPHISGTFPEGQRGSMHNAGVGLFFIAEMTKLTAGRLLVASRGGALLLEGDKDFDNRHRLRLLNDGPIGFPGTLVAFELPLRNIDDYDALIDTIQGLATARTPKRDPERWFSFDPAPLEAHTVLVRVAAENTADAHEFGQRQLLSRLVAREPITLDFTGLKICTQSFLHALLYEPLRVAWALRTPIFVRNATPAIRSTLGYLESYALGA